MAHSVNILSIPHYVRDIFLRAPFSRGDHCGDMRGSIAMTAKVRLFKLGTMDKENA